MLELLGQAIGDKLRAIWNALSGIGLNILEGLGWWVCEVERYVWGGPVNAWGTIRAGHPDIWDALRVAFQLLGSTIQTRFSLLLDFERGPIGNWVRAVLAATLAPIRDILTSWQGAITWVRDFAQDPAGKVWSLIQTTLFPKVEAFLNERWDTWS